MKQDHEKFILFDIPEDRTIDTDDNISSGSSSALLEASSERSISGGSHLFEKISRRWKGLDRASSRSNVKTLRGIYGSNCEGYAVVCLGQPANRKRSSLFSSNNSKSSSPKERFIFIKGAFCFIFKEEQSSGAKYVIRLAHSKTKITFTSRHMTVVMMQQARRRTYDEEGEEELLEHKFVFLRESHARNFCITANQMARLGETNEIHEKLGEDLVLHQNKSLRQVEGVVMETMDFER